ncbi:MAG: hypothetical protein JSR57_08295 [Verrucomicrobia bacterium]|nr:hypothetical protein [Verrucomicrobiota bacterium]
MIPRAKMNLHQCQFHLNTMKKANNAEEFEIGYAAFVMSSRTVTFVLQKEFKHRDHFNDWYIKKQNEMNDDKLFKFFIEQRNFIEKEGINALEFIMNINELQLSSGVNENSEISSIEILPKGTFYLVNKGTPREDLIPAALNGKITVGIFLRINGQPLNVLEVCTEHYNKLKRIVEEWTGIINKVNSV